MLDQNTKLLLLKYLGRVDQPIAGGIQLRHEGSREAAEGGLEGPGGRREVGRISFARHVGIADSVHGDASPRVTTTAAQVGGVDEAAAGGIQLRHEGVVFTAGGRLESPRGRGEVGR